MRPSKTEVRHLGNEDFSDCCVCVTQPVECVYDTVVPGNPGVCVLRTHTLVVPHFLDMLSSSAALVFALAAQAVLSEYI